MVNYNKKLSEVISFLRFPLAVLVVLIHATLVYELHNGVPYINETETPIYCIIDFLFRKSICSLSVPMFFFISGMLFFWNIDKLDLDIYRKKIKSRFFSLFIPYVFWNLLILIYIFIVQQSFPGLMSAKNKLVCDYTVMDYMNCFWNMSLVNNGGGIFPIDGPLWFVRDLVVMSVLSPIVYVLLSRIKVIGAVMIYLIWFFDVLGFLGNLSTAILFFSFGAYWGISKKNILEKTSRYKKVAWGGYLILLFMAVLFKDIDMPYLYKLEKTFGFIAILWLAVYLSERIHVNKVLAGSTFIIFAIHSDILKVLIKVFFKLTPLHNDIIYVAAYFTFALITIIISILVYRILNKYVPSFCSIISGGR